MASFARMPLSNQKQPSTSKKATRPDFCLDCVMTMLLVAPGLTESVTLGKEWGRMPHFQVAQKGKLAGTTIAPSTKGHPCNCHAQPTTSAKVLLPPPFIVSLPAETKEEPPTAVDCKPPMGWHEAKFCSLCQ
ncbi:hypothetical protein FH972_002123 [Carpinus fangiana]|uniref:Uncharacterized protein n=1 Tax=Carpinus fangiana TaxID=176857 RepID=A0A5N6QGA0_9ROSI|nr:hypothetical protein FH972_002123 [Carpinus fangiana]